MADQDSFDSVNAKIDDLKKQIDLHVKWLECMQAVATSENPFMFEEDILMLQNAIEQKTKELEELQFLGSQTLEVIARRKEFFKKMVLSGMRDANESLMEAFASNHKALVECAESERQNIFGATS